MIKTTSLFLLLVFSLSLVGCKSHEQGAQNCKIVTQALDQCVENSVEPISCDVAVEEIRQLLSLTSINDYNRAMWASNCKSLCTGSFAYSSAARSNYESNCMNSEVINIKDDRFIKLAVMSGLWLLGCIFLFFGMRSGIRVRRFVESCIKAKGVVIGHDTTSSDGSILYAPVIEFSDWMGRSHTITSNTYTSTMGKPSKAVDTVVDVIYPRDNPEQARYDSFMSLWLVPFILLVVGGGVVLISGFGLFGTNEWRGHHRYLQQHAPAIAGTANTVVHTVRKGVPLLTTIKDYRILDEKPDAIVIDVDYRLSPIKEGYIYMGAITLTDGHSGGEWSYRPARLHKGYGTAQVRLSMSSSGPDYYCSNEIELSIYLSGKSSFYERVIPYEKCWSRQ